MNEQRPKRRWPQFRLRTLLIVVVLLSLPLSWFAARMERARRQREVVKVIKRMGGGVCYDHTGPSVPRWMRKCLGDDLFRDVIVVHFETPLPWESTEANDAWLERLTVLTDLRVLTLYDDVSDIGVGHLKELTMLEDLTIGGPESMITDAGLEQLKGLKRLKALNVESTEITDAGLEHLKGLAALKSLSIWSNKITDAGLEHLKGLGELEELQIGSYWITDVGLMHLTGLTNLQLVRLHCTEVTDEGMDKFREALPNCEIEY